MASDFSLRVYQAVQLVPAGYVTTYQEIAKFIGHPKSCRAVGQVLKRNQHAVGGLLPLIACHRVIKSNGQVGGFRGSPDNREKITILTNEQVVIRNGKITDTKYLFVFPPPED